MNNKKYSLVHSHNEYSNSILLDSVSSSADMFRTAKELGLHGIIMTNHGNTLGWYNTSKQAKENGYKYIHASEIYIIDDYSKKDGGYHLLVYAKNKKGFLELNKLISTSYKRQGQFYRRPRVLLEDLIKTNNLIVSFSCVATPLYDYLNLSVSDPMRESSAKITESLLYKFKDELMCEIQPHRDDKQIKYNFQVIEFAKLNGLKVTVSNDCHAHNNISSQGRTLLQKQGKQDETDEDRFDLRMKHHGQMISLLEPYRDSIDIEEVLENTNIIYDSCEDIEMDYTYKYPRLYADSKKEILAICNNRLNELNIYSNEYLDRLNEEIETMQDIDATDYMLLFGEWLGGVREKGVRPGPGRGSSAGSLVAYLLGITELDPIIFGTLFSRFMNRYRTSMLDIDTDFSESDRVVAKQWLYDHDKLNCSSIVTFGTFGEASAIDAICRIKGLSSSDYKNMSTEDKEKHKDFFKDVEALAGTIKSIGVHASGTLVSTEDIESTIGLITNKDGEIISQLSMKELDALGYVKADILGLKNIDVINKTYDDIGIKRPLPHEINYDDDFVWDNLKTSPVSIFQFESPQSHSKLAKAISNVKGSREHIMSAMNGLVRPQGISLVDNYMNGFVFDWGIPEMNELFKNTSGNCVYEDTKISTLDGYKKIKDINVGDMVNTLDGYRKVNVVFDNGAKECYELITKCGYKLTCTSDHKIMTPSGYKKVKDLDISLDSIVISLDDCTKNEDISIEYARILGMLCGDGMLTQKRLVRFISNNIEQAQEFKNLVSSEFEDCEVVIREDFYEEKNNLFVCNVINTVKGSNNIKSIVKELIIDGYKTLDGGCGALNKFIPKRVMNSNKSIKLSFISGLLDTDGSITARGHVRFKTASSQLANDIQDILRSIGYMSNICKSHEKSYDITVRNGSYLHFELIGLSNKANSIQYIKKAKRGVKIVSPRFINENLTKSYSKEKYPDIKKGKLSSLFSPKSKVSLDRIKGCSLEKELKKETLYLLNKECCFDIIDSISSVGIKKVYDIEVDDNHSYFANGIVVHNCVYQEDITKYLNRFCGFDDYKADIVRRNSAKKDPKAVEESLIEIREGFMNNFGKTLSSEVAEETIETFLTIVDNSKDYGLTL